MNQVKTISHPLRTIFLRFDESKTAPGFETEALGHYHEIHDRLYEIRQRINGRRKLIAPFVMQVEAVADLLEHAKLKFDHLEMMIPENPEKETVRTQLKTLMADIDAVLDGFVPALSDAATDFFDYDDYSYAHDQWMMDTAFPLFDRISAQYESCSVDLVSFDRDLNDFKTVLAFVKKQEGRYLDAMNGLIETYSDLNYEIDLFFSKVADFDDNLVQYGRT
ncbi:hypothetical protein [Parapedobacter tibetensis]|uniref:hypothetical protein n=1 Tax=Parapedobacter tibetensis TaxID=2972951 RepID=UPI00214D8830|nr:hypothetical protein [Parapedobacter tibetensis]